ncbi:MAG: hypothetical protein ACRD4R_12955 [Candidatus Acidiferrales bacterium]
MWSTIVTWVLRGLTVLPGLITDVEKLWSGVSGKGASKWQSVETALAGSIEEAATDAAKLAPAGTDAATISNAIAVFTKDVNDAFVALMNDLKLFQHAPAPSPAPAVTPAKK